MRKIAYIQKLGNGVMLTVTDESGNDVPFFMPDNGSAAYRSVAQPAEAAGGDKKAVYLQKLGNGVMLCVEGGDDFFLPTNDSDVFKDLTRAYDMASATAKQTVHEDEDEDEDEYEDEPRRGPSFNFGHEDAHEYSDDPDAFEVGSYYVRKFARVVNENPSLGNFLGGLIEGANSLEEKRHRMKQAQRPRKKKK